MGFHGSHVFRPHETAYFALPDERPFPFSGPDFLPPHCLTSLPYVIHRNQKCFRQRPCSPLPLSHLPFALLTQTMVLFGRWLVSRGSSASVAKRCSRGVSFLFACAPFSSSECNGGSLILTPPFRLLCEWEFVPPSGHLLPQFISVVFLGFSFPHLFGFFFGLLSSAYARF